MCLTKATTDLWWLFGQVRALRSAEAYASVSTGRDAVRARGVEAVNTNYSATQRGVVFSHTIVESMVMTILPPNYNGGQAFSALANEASRSQLFLPTIRANV